MKINLVTIHDSYEAWREKDKDDLVHLVLRSLRSEIRTSCTRSWK